MQNLRLLLFLTLLSATYKLFVRKHTGRMVPHFLKVHVWLLLVNFSNAGLLGNIVFSEQAENRCLMAALLLVG